MPYLKYEVQIHFKPEFLGVAFQPYRYGRNHKDSSIKIISAFKSWTVVGCFWQTNHK